MGFELSARFRRCHSLERLLRVRNHKNWIHGDVLCILIRISEVVSHAECTCHCESDLSCPCSARVHRFLEEQGRQLYLSSSLSRNWPSGAGFKKEHQAASQICPGSECHRLPPGDRLDGHGLAVLTDALLYPLDRGSHLFAPVLEHIFPLRHYQVFQ